MKKIIEIIKKAANDAGLTPGVYRMINAKNEVIYVGKAKYLKNRLLSYSHFDKLSNRIKMMVSKIAKIEFTIVNSENEALLLEDNLIKHLKPFYNILLKDDKTFPYIVIDESHDFPRIFKYRTKHPKSKNFFGPYPSSMALDDTIKMIQKTFMLRTCTDTYLSNRQRPCLQFFIKRCSAPCMNKISKEEYAEHVRMSKDLLNGKDEGIRKVLVDQMNSASKLMEFEKAAVIRDQLKSLSEIQSKQYIQIDSLNSIDFISIASNISKSVVGVTFYRTGKNVGTDTFILENTSQESQSEILISFIEQYYGTVSTPSEIVTNIEIPQANVDTLFEHPPKITYTERGTFHKVLRSTYLNAENKLRQISGNKFESEIVELCKLLSVDSIDRIETYDNSHIQGTNACGVMVVFESGAIQKNKARKFNIDEKTANDGDDISMMQFSLEKRFKSKRIPEIPDLVIIDGGKTQVSIAKNVIESFGLLERVKIIGVAKQNNRHMGDEKIVFDNMSEVILGSESDLLKFIITLRNEAHKTAITFHRKKRRSKLSKSILDDIQGIGASRKRILLEHFGSIENIKKASIDDLKMVKGIDNSTAEMICNFFRKAKS